MISTRFLPIVCALLVLALVPTFIHSYADPRLHDGRSTATIPTALAGYSGTPSGRNAAWGQRRFESADWTERMYRSPGDEVKLTVVRSYDAKALYHHPELAVSYGISFVRTEVKRFSQRPDIPVHVLHTDNSDGTTAAYVLHYDDTFVLDPIRFQIRTAAEMLFSGRKAMTLFFLTDESVPTGIEVDALPSIALLLAAIEYFVASDGPPQ